MRTWALVVAALLLGSSPGFAAPVQVSLNDQPIAATPIVRNGRVLLPFRAIFGAMGASITYRQVDHRIFAHRGGDRLTLTIGSTDAFVSERHVRLDVAPLLLDERTYVPVRFVSQSFGARVQYDATDRIVFIRDPRSPAYVSNASVKTTPAFEIYQPHTPADVSNLFPRAGQTFEGAYPIISAAIITHGSTISSGQIELLVDGVNVGRLAEFDGNTISYTPTNALSNGWHQVVVQGTDSSGTAFSHFWSFSTQYTISGAYYPSYFQSMNFYIPQGGPFVFYPGQRVRFVLIAPPGGSAYLRLCGFGNLSFINPLYTTHYFTSFIVPDQLRGSVCAPVAYYTGVLGAQAVIPLSEELVFAQPRPTPTPQPTFVPPTPLPTQTPAWRGTEPVGRQPQQHPAPTPMPLATPPPRIVATPAPPAAPTARPSVRPRPRPTREIQGTPKP